MIVCFVKVAQSHSLSISSHATALLPASNIGESGGEEAAKKMVKVKGAVSTNTVEQIILMHTCAVHRHDTSKPAPMVRAQDEIALCHWQWVHPE